MKLFRPVVAVLLVVTLGLAASAQDSTEFNLLRTKAEKGNGIAQYNLGLAYLQGRGTAVDPVAAYLWLSLASDNGARGRALDGLIGSLDRATLQVAEQKLAAYKTANGLTAPVAAVRAEPAEPQGKPATEVSVETPQAPPVPPGGVRPAIQAIPATATDDAALARLRGERDTLAARVTDLGVEITGLRADRLRLAQIAAEKEKSAENATDAGRTLQEQAKAAAARIADLTRTAAAAQADLEQAKQHITALEQAPKPVPDTAALDAKTRELQAAQADLEASRTFGRKVEDTLNKVNDEKAGVAAAAAAELDSAKKFGHEVETTLNRVNDEKAALATQLAQANQALAAKSGAPAYPDLSGKVAELQDQLAQAKQPVAPAYPDLRGNVTALEAQVAALSADTGRAKQDAAALAQAKADLSAAATALAETDARVATLTKAKESAEAALAAKPAAPAYPDLSGKVAELQTALAAARNAAPAYPDLSGKVGSLENQVARLTAENSRGQQAVATLTRNAADLISEAAKAKQESATLAQAQEEARQALAAARQAQPAYPDLSGRVTELETKLASTEKALAEKPAAPAYPDLSGKVAALEAAGTKAREEAAQTLTAAEQSRRDLSKQFDAYKSATVASQRESTTLQASVQMLESDKASLRHQAETAATEADQLRAQVAALKTAAALKPAIPAAPTYPDLSGKVAELEASLATARNAAPAYPNLADKVTALEASVASLTKARDDATAQASGLAAERDAAHNGQNELRDAVTQLTQEKAALTAAVETARKAAPAYPDLSGKVQELAAGLAAANGRVTELNIAADEHAKLAASLQGELQQTQAALAAKPAAPSYPDLSSRVTELEGALASAKQQTAASSQQAAADLAAANTQVAQLKTALAEKPAAPTYPDLSGRVSELEAKLASTEQTAAAKPVAPAYPDLSGKVTALEATVANLTTDVAQARQSRGELSKQFDAYKTATIASQRESTSLQANVKMLESDKISLRHQAEVATADADQLRTQVATLKVAAAGVKPAAPAYPDLSGRVKELETAVAGSLQHLADRELQLKQSQEALAAKPVAPAYPDLSGRVAELETKLAATEKAAAAQPAAPAYPDLRNQVADLDNQVATLKARPAAPSYPDLSGRVHELETQLAAKPSTPAYPDLSGKVQELEAGLTTANGRVAELSTAAEEHTKLAASLQAELQQTQAALAAKPAAPAYPDLSGRVSELEGKLAGAEKAAAEKPVAPAYPDLRSQVTDLETQLAAARNRPVAPPGYLDHVRDLEAKLAAAEQAAIAASAKTNEPAYPDLSGKVAELETALADSSRQLVAANTASTQLQAQLADATAKAKTDDSAQLRRERDELSGRVTSLAGDVATLRSDRERMQKMLAEAGKQMRDGAADASRIKELETQAATTGSQLESANAQVAQLKTALAAQPGAPAYPDLSDKVTALQSQVATLTQARDEAAKAGHAPAYPDLSGRVSELEGALATAKSQLADTQTSLQAEQAKSAPATTAPVVAAVDTADLQKQLAETEDKLAISLRGYAALQRERDALADSAGKSTDAATADKNALAARLADVEGRVAAAQAEAASANAALGALQRSTAQSTNDLAAVRALAQQLQGSNTVLASENYQLKTMLSRSTGAPAPASGAPLAANPVPAVRTHVIAAGDSLSRISQRYYGTAARWPDIYNANRDKIGPDGILHVGLELRIP